MSAYWPLVQARLVELLPTLFLSEDVVWYGPSAGREKGAKQYVTVGWTSDGSSGSHDQPDSPITGVRQERGEVACEFVDWSGDTDLPAKVAEVYRWAELLETSVRDDQTLGILPDASTVTLAGEPFLSPTTARLVVTVSYFVPLSA